MTKQYTWSFTIEEIRSTYVEASNCPECLTADNREAWCRYIRKRIGELMTDETMQKAEFKAIEEQVTKERQQREEYDRKREQQRKRQAEERSRRSSMERPKIAYIPKGLTTDYVEEYGRLMKQEVEFTPTCHDDYLYQRRMLERWYRKSIPHLIAMGRPDAAYAVSVALCRAIPTFIFREDLQAEHDTQRQQLRQLVKGTLEGMVEAVTAWNNETERRKVCDLLFKEAKRYKDWRGMTRTLITMMPSASFEGEPLAVTKEMTEEEKAAEQRRLQEEKRRQEEEKESRSVIPLNPDYEQRIFSRRHIDWGCDWIWHLMLEENKRIKELTWKDRYQEAALRYMQLTKSMCRHFINDEHYSYYDDMYSPEYAIDELTEHFERLSKTGLLPEATRDYIRQAWKEIEDTEAYRDYGMPSRKARLD